MSTPAEPAGHVVGLKPWFPWPLGRWGWWVEPVRAERLAALRIGIALFTLFDVLTSYLPRSGDYFGPDSVGPADVFAYRFKNGLRWSVLNWGDLGSSPAGVRALMVVWAAAALLLLVGAFSRLGALVAWVIGVSVANSNTAIDNAGDTVRTLATFYLVLSPCGAAWSVDAWWRRRYRWLIDVAPGVGLAGVRMLRRPAPLTGPCFIHPWPLRLLFVQMMMIYLFNGLHKVSGTTWHDGSSLYYVLCDLTLARYSYAMLPLPYWLTAYMTIVVLWWEVLFAPVMLVPWRWLADRLYAVRWGGLWRLDVLLRWNREIFLAFGASFHVGILFGMEIGLFACYMLCLYLPLLPWERLARPAPLPLAASGAA